MPPPPCDVDRRRTSRGNDDCRPESRGDVRDCSPASRSPRATPDKICDAISDSILDALLRAGTRPSRVAVETLVTTGQVHVAGEVTTSAYADIPKIVRDKVLEIGYDSSSKGFDGATAGVNVAIGAQSPDHRAGCGQRLRVPRRRSDRRDRQAGRRRPGPDVRVRHRRDPEFMPVPIALAHRLSRKLTEVRKNGTLPYLRPDGKTQVTIEYDGDTPVRLDTVVLSTQHAADIDLVNMLTPDIKTHVVDAVLADLELPSLDTSNPRLLVNPTGKFVLGGPMGDAGLTGRKIIVDTYGGMARHGGGAFSGKDPSKVDRSAAYAMRWVAKNAVAAGLAKRIEVQVAYAIGKAAPVGLFVETFGTEAIDPVAIRRPSARSSTCGRARSSATWTCCARSTPRPPRTVTSVAPTWTCRGSAPTAPTS
ncbi:MAG: methionine adenosyltransferase [Gordonia paraffinivorans]